MDVYRGNSNIRGLGRAAAPSPSFEHNLVHNSLIQGLRMKIAGVFDGMEADVIRGVSWQSGGLHVGEEFGGRILSVGRSSL
jgi:hypothetical protein